MADDIESVVQGGDRKRDSDEMGMNRPLKPGEDKPSPLLCLRMRRLRNQGNGKLLRITPGRGLPSSFPERGCHCPYYAYARIGW